MGSVGDKSPDGAVILERVANQETRVADRSLRRLRGASAAYAQMKVSTEALCANGFDLSNTELFCRPVFEGFFLGTFSRRKHGSMEQYGA